jgi:tripartite-type tricarboxylate transporter receptor subunit TctC
MHTFVLHAVSSMVMSTVMGRTLAQALQVFLGKPVVVDDRGGVAGITDADVVAKALADDP